MQTEHGLTAIEVNLEQASAHEMSDAARQLLEVARLRLRALNGGYTDVAAAPDQDLAKLLGLASRPSPPPAAAEANGTRPRPERRGSQRDSVLSAILDNASKGDVITSGIVCGWFAAALGREVTSAESQAVQHVLRVGTESTWWKRKNVGTTDNPRYGRGCRFPYVTISQPLSWMTDQTSGVYG